ncbi:MAG: hypothetical protein WBX01_08175 [Nitrososphaeraceae archaeon]
MNSNQQQQMPQLCLFAIVISTSVLVVLLFTSTSTSGTTLLSIHHLQQKALATSSLNNNTTTNDNTQLPKPFTGGQVPISNFTATNTYIVQGQTPEGGVDAFSYDGSGHLKLKSGVIDVDVDPISQTGMINATWVDNENNNWSFTQTQFMPGQQLYFEGILPNGTAKTIIGNDSVAINHWEHGNTNGGAPVLPTVFTYVGTWGPGELWRNGENLGTVGGHMMLTDGVRDPISGKVYAADKASTYNPMNPADGYSDPKTAQVHLIIQSPPGPMTNNFPPQFDFTAHLMFYDIEVN